MMAKKAQYFLHHVRTEFLIDTQLLDDKFIRDLHLKTGKSKSKIKDATIFIRKGLNPNARVTEDDLIKMNNLLDEIDRKSTRLNSSHVAISYAVFCLKKK